MTTQRRNDLVGGDKDDLQEGAFEGAQKQRSVGVR